MGFEPVLIIILISIIGLVGIIVGLIINYNLNKKKKTSECPKCGGTNTILLKTEQFCPICNKNTGVYKCLDCDINFLECKHPLFELKTKK
ncbi:MAG: hypothetical protein ACTSRP_14385 [Candidatus Helarchaeota archaeon]